MKHIVNVSGGRASGVALFRVLERFPREEVYAGFADTRAESADLYRFLDDLERAAGIPIARLSDGRDAWDVWFESFMFTTGLNGGCRASWELKRKPLEAWRRTVASPEDAVVYIGYGMDEEARVERLLKSDIIWTFDFPLRWKPHLGPCDLSDFLIQHGVKPAADYDKGYKHANCGGACILAGIAQWCGLLKDDPLRFRAYEEKEQQFLAGLRERNRTEITILKDRRGGAVNNLSLKQLREEIEAGIREPKDTWRLSTCSCTGLLF